MSKFANELIASLKQAAEIVMTERRRVTIPAKDWERFEAWARKPAREVPALKELAKRPPTWRK
ncbi:MAG: DUF1778 domain-containing protein [Xanthobacteraceae bacterium]